MSAYNHNILIVDNEKNILDSLYMLLINETYDVYTADDIEQCFEIMNNFQISLIISDYKIQDVEGITLLKKIKFMYPDTIRMLFRDSCNGRQIENMNEDLVYQVISKSWNDNEMKMMIKRSLERYDLEKRNKKLYGMLHHKNYNKSISLEQEIQNRIDQIKNIQDASIFSLAKLAEYREPGTGAHLKRTRVYVKIITNQLKNIDKYKKYISEDYIYSIQQSSILHDIGKVGIADGILLKPGKLTNSEFNIIEKHSIIGGETLAVAEKRIREKSFLSIGKAIAYHHHEKWNGEGYPGGLKGEEIPLSARIMALADVYDALTTERPYKLAFSHEKTCSIIADDKEKHFDPDIVDIFLKSQHIFQSISKKMATENTYL